MFNKQVLQCFAGAEPVKEVTGLQDHMIGMLQNFLRLSFV